MLRMLCTRHVSLLHLFSPPEQIAKVAQSQNFSGKCLMGEASLMLQRAERVRFWNPSVREGDVPICGGCPNRGFKPPCILEISQSLVRAAQGVRGAAAVEPPALSSFRSRLFPPFPFLFLSLPNLPVYFSLSRLPLPHHTSHASARHQRPALTLRAPLLRRAEHPRPRAFPEPTHTWGLPGSSPPAWAARCRHVLPHKAQSGDFLIVFF